jgi:hypothetical protein
MAKTRINWIEAKSRYLTGNIDDVTAFLADQYQLKTRSGRTVEMTNGWKEERKAYHKRLAERREQALMNNPLIDENAEKLLILENKIMDIAIKGLKDFEELIEFDQGGTPIINRNIAGLRNLWEMARISQNKHINGTKNENINKNIDFKDFVNALKNADT